MSLRNTVPAGASPLASETILSLKLRSQHVPQLRLTQEPQALLRGAEPDVVEVPCP